MNTVFITLARLLRFLNAPHVIKYILFIFIRGKKVYTPATIEFSHTAITLNLGEFIEYWIFVDGAYEKEWILQASQLIKDKSFIDIGANIGIYSLSLYKTAKEVYAVEPERNNFERLNKIIKQNAIMNITSLKLALYSTDNHRVNLYTSSKDAGWHSLSINYENKSQQVNTITLDTLISKQKIKNIGLIKIDVEGAEYEVLKGANKTLTRIHPPVIIEFNRPRALLGNHSIEQLYKEFKKYNYAGFILKKKQLEKMTEKSLTKIYNENVLFLYQPTKAKK
jgi:FkbM family methyltransferase